MFRFIVSAALVLAIATPVFGQMSAADAMAKLKAKQAARENERAKPVTITQGELDDLKAEINRLKAQLAALQIKAAPVTAPATVPLPQSLTVGISRAEVLRFIQVHHETFELKMDDDAPNPTAKGIMLVVEKAKHKVFDGSFAYNGQTHFANFREQLRPDKEYTLSMMGGKVTAVSSQKITTAMPDEVAPIWRGR